MDMESLMAQAQDLQSKISSAQDALENMTVKGIAENGAAVVSMTGKYDVLSVVIKPETLALGAEKVSQIVMDAYKDAKIKADVLIDKTMSAITGGLGDEQTSMYVNYLSGVSPDYFLFSSLTVTNKNKNRDKLGLNFWWTLRDTLGNSCLCGIPDDFTALKLVKSTHSRTPSFSSLTVTNKNKNRDKLGLNFWWTLRDSNS